MRKQVDAILPTLVKDPTIQLLIQEQANTYLDSLSTTLNPKLQALIRQQGDDYITYLNAHPEQVQNLVAGQTIGMTTEIMNEVRERAVTADSVVEMLVRRVLGRKQREELPTAAAGGAAPRRGGPPALGLCRWGGHAVPKVAAVQKAVTQWRPRMTRATCVTAACWASMPDSSRAPQRC